MDKKVLIHSDNMNSNILTTNKKVKYTEKLEQLQRNELKNQ